MPVAWGAQESWGEMRACLLLCSMYLEWAQWNLPPYDLITSLQTWVHSLWSDNLFRDQGPCTVEPVTTWPHHLLDAWVHYLAFHVYIMCCLGLPRTDMTSFHSIALNTLIMCPTYLQLHVSVCDLVYTECPNCCGHSCQRKDLTPHLSCCVNKPQQCPQCSIHFARNRLDEHKSHCSKMVIPESIQSTLFKVRLSKILWWSYTIHSHCTEKSSELRPYYCVAFWKIKCWQISGSPLQSNSIVYIQMFTAGKWSSEVEWYDQVENNCKYSSDTKMVT